VSPLLLLASGILSLCASILILHATQTFGTLEARELVGIVTAQISTTSGAVNSGAPPFGPVYLFDPAKFF